MTHKRRSPCCELEAIRYLNTHPSDESVTFTVDSLAEQLVNVDWRRYVNTHMFPDGSKRTDYDWDAFAAAIIKAAKEAERE